MVLHLQNFYQKIRFVPSLIEIDQVIFQMPTIYQVCIFAIISPWKRSWVYSLIKPEYPSPKDNLEMNIFNVFKLLLLYLHLDKGNDQNFQLKTLALFVVSIITIQLSTFKYSFCQVPWESGLLYVFSTPCMRSKVIK